MQIFREYGGAIGDTQYCCPNDLDQVHSDPSLSDRLLHSSSQRREYDKVGWVPERGKYHVASMFCTMHQKPPKRSTTQSDRQSLLRAVYSTPTGSDVLSKKKPILMLYETCNTGAALPLLSLRLYHRVTLFEKKICCCCPSSPRNEINRISHL